MDISETSDNVTITWENMSQYSIFPIDYCFVDYVEVSPGKKARGKKLVSSQDWYFKIHFPGNPIMPGVLVMEMVKQTSVFIVTTLEDVKEKEMIIHGCEKMRMYNTVRPGDTIFIQVLLEKNIDNEFFFRGEARINRSGEQSDLLACSMSFSIMFMSDFTTKQIFVEEKIPELVQNNTRVFDYTNMDCVLADPIEYRFVDNVIVDSSMGVGKKNSSYLDWYYRYNDLYMPIEFVLEAIMQTGVLIVTQNKEKTDSLMMFSGCENVQIYSLIRPGDSFKTCTVMKRYKNGIAKYHGFAMVEERIVCTLDFMLVHPLDMAKITVKRNKKGERDA